MSRFAVAGGGGQADLNSDADKLRSALHEVFTKIDEDKGGSLDKDEFGGIFEEIQMPLTKTELDGVFADIDKDGGGDIDFDEFCQWMMGMHPKAVALRHNLSSNVLGGLALDEFIDDEELEALEAEKRKDWASPQHRAGGWLYAAPGDPGKTVFIFLDEPESSRGAKFMSLFMQLLIFISSVIFIIETLEKVRADQELLETFHVVEWMCIFAFTIEYLMRVATCTRRPSANRQLWPYISQPMNAIDVLAIMPAYVEWLMGNGSGSFAVLRILRMARIFRVLKVGGAAKNLSLVFEGLRQSKTGLILLIYLVLIFMVIMSSVIYMVEGGEGTPFPSIPSTFWFTIVTMTSVGYGDIYPATSAGHFFGCIIMLSGILTLAVPITLIGNKFHAVWIAEKQKDRKKAMMIEMQAGGHETGGPEGGGGGQGVVTEVALNSRVRTAVVMLQHSGRSTRDPRFMQAIDALADLFPECFPEKGGRSKSEQLPPEPGSPTAVDET